MKFLDKIRISQSNLLRSKLRTLLTIGAVFIGAFTISLTNGVGNGIKSYVDLQLGNVGAENTLLVQVASPQQNPINTDVKEYDPNRTTGIFRQSLMTKKDAEIIRSIAGVRQVTPQLNVLVEYITSADKKYQATV